MHTCKRCSCAGTYHGWRWIDTDNATLSTHRLGEQPREVAGTTTDIQDALTGLHVSGGDQCLKSRAPAAEEEEVGEDVVQARRSERVAACDGPMR